jgi:hypothetical protein
MSIMKEIQSFAKMASPAPSVFNLVATRGLSAYVTYAVKRNTLVTFHVYCVMD